MRNENVACAGNLMQLHSSVYLRSMYTVSHPWCVDRNMALQRPPEAPRVPNPSTLAFVPPTRCRLAVVRVPPYTGCIWGFDHAFKS